MVADFEWKPALRISVQSRRDADVDLFAETAFSTWADMGVSSHWRAPIHLRLGSVFSGTRALRVRKAYRSAPTSAHADIGIKESARFFLLIVGQECASNRPVRPR